MKSIRQSKGPEEFSDGSYMNPTGDRMKYKDRDPEVGKWEAERRLAILPDLEKASLSYCVKNSIEPPMLLPKGSTAVNMCDPGSDFDIAVIVQWGHIFTSEPQKWRDYQSMLEVVLETNFKVEPRLVVEQRMSTASRLFDLAGERIRDDTFAQDLLGKMKDILLNNQ